MPTVTATTPDAGGNVSPTAPGLSSAAAGGNLAPTVPGGSGAAAGGNLSPTAPGLSSGVAGGNLAPTAPGLSLAVSDGNLSPSIPGSTSASIVDTAATLLTAFTNANSNLLITVRVPVANQSLYSLTVVEPVTSNEALSVSISGQAITVHLATGPIVAATATVAFSRQPTDGNAIFISGESNFGRGFFTGLAGPPGFVKVQGTLTATLDFFVAGFNASNAGTATVVRSGNSLVFTAISTGRAGNTKTISVTGSAMSVSAGTFTGGTSYTSTASQVRTALMSNSNVSGMLLVALAPGNSGAGLMMPMAQTFFSGGVPFSPDIGASTTAATGNIAPAAPGLSTAAAGGNLSPSAPGAIS